MSPTRHTTLRRATALATLLASLGGEAGPTLAGPGQRLPESTGDFITLKLDPDLPKWVATEEATKKPAPSPRPQGTLAQRPQSEEGVLHVVDQDLRSLVGEYARDRGMTAQIGSDVRVRVANATLPLTPDRFVKALQDRYHVAAYFEGDRLVVADQSSAATRLIPLDALEFDRLKAQIANALPAEAIALKHLPDSNSVLVTASAQLVAQVAGIIEASRSRADFGQVKVIRFGKISK